MIRRLALLVLPALLAAAPAPAFANTISWYNGDLSDNGLANGANTGNPSSVYDNFLVPLGGWTLDGAFANNLMTFTGVTTANVEIRSGMSAGNGGTLVYSAYGVAATQTPTTRTFLQYPEYTIQVALPNVALGAGTYWLMVAPMGSGGGESYVSTTSGANCIGSPCGNDGNSYWDSDFYVVDFASTSTIFGDPADFSMGVLTTDAAPVPEPTTLLLFGTGLAAAGVRRYRKRQ